jgi:CrcB protein
MKLILLIGAGSFLGGVSRYLLSLAVQPRAALFPTGTLAVNITGCLCVGIVFGLFDRGQITHEWRMFLATGFLGGFTTFSAFSNETFMLFRDGQAGYALLYIALSVILGLSATWLAYQIVK